MSEEDYNKEPTKHADMTTIMMQGNIDSVDAVMSALAMASDTANDGWLTRLNSSKGLDGIIEKYEKDYPSLAESKQTR